MKFKLFGIFVDDRDKARKAIRVSWSPRHAAG